MLAHYIWIQSRTGLPSALVHNSLTRRQQMPTVRSTQQSGVYRQSDVQVLMFFAFIDRLAQALKHNSTFQLAKLVPATRARRRSGP
jgi:hypothetical protein